MSPEQIPCMLMIRTQNDWVMMFFIRECDIREKSIHGYVRAIIGSGETNPYTSINSCSQVIAVVVTQASMTSVALP